ncbi:MAG: hypothetical protein ACE5FF_17170, partial [Saprospiraceae bacterium]
MLKEIDGKPMDFVTSGPRCAAPKGKGPAIIDDYETTDVLGDFSLPICKWARPSTGIQILA